jgi:prevent-host-death family protein
MAPVPGLNAGLSVDLSAIERCPQFGVSSFILTWRSILATLLLVTRVKIGEFRDRASELIRRAAGGETVVILNRNREVAKIVPITTKTDRAGGLVGSLAGTAEVQGDIESPIASPDAWFRDRT